MIVSKDLLMCGQYLILQVNRFDIFNGTFRKNVEKIVIGPEVLSVSTPAYENIHFKKTFKLIASVNHDGTLESGHYWAFLKFKDSWFRCNDRAVLPAKNSDVFTNRSCYILVFEQDK